MSENKKTLIRIAVAAAAFIAAFCIERFCGLAWYYNLIVFLAPYLLLSYDIFVKAAINIRHGRIFDENFLMLIATIGAFCLRDFPEAVAVMLFYQVGELFQRFAVGKSRRSIRHLLDMCPTSARVEREGAVFDVTPEDVEPGETVLVRVGERIPIDGTIESGETYLDVSALTGESLPVSARRGDAVLSGAINTTSLIKICTTKRFEDSAVSKILELVENASDKKTRAEQFITVFSRYYTPIVVGLALLLCLIPSLVTGAWLIWGERALSFLVVSCPCALVISVPMSFFGGIGCASKHGILLKGSTYFEIVDKVNTVAFDKTGTLTKGAFEVIEVQPASRRAEILRLAAIAEQSSTHPIADAIRHSADVDYADGYALTDWTGEGVAVERGKERILAGNGRLMARFNIATDLTPKETGSVVYVASDGAMVGLIVVGDEIKECASSVVAELKRIGIKTVMLSGDLESTARAVGERVGVDEVYAGLLPGDKVARIETMLDAGDKVAFVGDGVNDAPVLMRADVGIAMGGIGSDAAIDAADIVITHDDLGALSLLKRIARKTTRIVCENVIFALAVKAAVLVLSALGITNMWMAVFADVGVAVLAILNAMRAMRIDHSYDKRQKVVEPEIAVIEKIEE